MTEEILYTDCCGATADNVDGTDMRCLLCGAVEVNLLTKKELEEND